MTTHQLVSSVGSYGRSALVYENWE